MGKYSQLTIEFDFYMDSMENNEDFFLEFYDGSSWAVVGSWARGSEFGNHKLYSQSVHILNDGSFPNCAEPQCGPDESGAKLRFRCDASGNGDRVYIDNVRFIGVP